MRDSQPKALALERFASGAWLTLPLASFAAALMIVGTAASIVFLVATANGTLDFLGRPIGTDFSSFWTAGRMALEGRAPEAYDWTAHLEMQRQTHGTDMFFPWSYPPVFLMVASAFAMLPYVPAFFVWQGATMLLAVTTLWKILPRRSALLFGFGFPAVLICLGHGQTGFLTATLMAGGILLLPRSEILAGLLFGLLVYKPQFGVLLPFVLAAGGYWRTFTAAAVTVLASSALTLLFWGWPVWAAFFESMGPTRTIVFELGDTGFEKFQSAFAWVRLWGGSVPLAYGLQALTAAGVLIACIWIWRSAVPLRLKGAALLTGSLLVSPYTLDYDLVVLGMALAFFAAHALERGFQPWDKTLLAFGWFTPVLARTMAKTVLLPVGFFALVAIFILIIVRARDARATAQETFTPTFALT